MESLYVYSVVDYSFDSVFFFGSVLELRLFFKLLFDPPPPGGVPFQQGHVKNVMDSPARLGSFSLDSGLRSYLSVSDSNNGYSGLSTHSRGRSAKSGNYQVSSF